MRIKDLYSEIVRQLEAELMLKSPKYRITTTKRLDTSLTVFGLVIREMLKKCESMFRQLCLKERLELAERARS